MRNIFIYSIPSPTTVTITITLAHMLMCKLSGTENSVRFVHIYIISIKNSTKGIVGSQ